MNTTPSLTLDELVAAIRKAVQTGNATVSPAGRLRMDAVNMHASAAFRAIESGEAFPCRESDRAKFVNDECIVFVALGKGFTGLDHAFVVSAFLQRKPV